METAYKRWRVILVMVAILIAAMADHLSSPTFAYNMGQGVETSLMQRDANACAPCGAPCPSASQND